MPSKLLIFILMMISCSSFVVAQTIKPLEVAIPDIFPIGCAPSKEHPPCLANSLFDKIAVHANLTFKFNITPLGRIVKSAVEGEGDLLMMVEHPTLMAATTPIAKSHKLEIGFFSNNMDLVHQPISQKRIPLLRGIPFPDEFAQLGEVIIIPTLDHKQMIGMFAKGRLDAVIGPKIYLRSSMKRFNIDVNHIYEVIPPWIQQIWLYCVKDKCDQGIQKRLAEATESIQQADVDRILFELGHSLKPEGLSESSKDKLK